VPIPVFRIKNDNRDATPISLWQSDGDLDDVGRKPNTEPESDDHHDDLHYGLHDIAGGSKGPQLAALPNPSLRAKSAPVFKAAIGGLVLPSSTPRALHHAPIAQLVYCACAPIKDELQRFPD